MKKMMLLMAAFGIAASVAAQTLNVNQGNVTYAFPSSQMGDAVVTSNAILVGQKSFAVNAISSIVVDDTEVSDNSVKVQYNGTAAHVTIAGNIAHLVTPVVNGAHVALLQDASVAEEITYTLSGSSDNGSFYMAGNYKCTVELKGVSLHNPDSAAINIEDGKRIAIALKKDTDNRLSDGLRGSDDGSNGHKACLYVDGHPEFSGSGSLTVTGNVKHAISTDEYCQLKSSVGTITIVAAQSDGLHVGQYFQQDGGTLVINASGDGIDVSKKKDPSTENNGKVFLNAGSLTITTDGKACKGIKSDDSVEINGAIIDITVKGDAVYDAETADASSSAAIKGSLFTMTSGTVSLLATGLGGKLINSDGLVSISGGKITGAACGDIYVYSPTVDSKSHGIKSDADIVISGGEVYIAASEDEAKAFKTDLMFAIKGGTVMGIGGKKSTPGADSTQGFKEYKDVVVRGGATVSYDGVSFTVPAEYENTGAKVMVSKAGM